MFAPSTIQIRYGAAGQVGPDPREAARLHAMSIGGGLAGEAMNLAERRSEFDQRNQIENQKLQLAGQIAQSRAGSATGYTANGQFTPLTQAIMTAKGSMVQQLSPDVPDSDRAVINAIAADPTSHPEQVAREIARVNKLSSDRKSKESDLKEVEGLVSPEDAARLRAQANDNAVPSHEHRMAIQQAIQKFAKQKQTTDKQTDFETAKADLMSGLVDLPDEAKRGLSTLATSASVSPIQLMHAIDHVQATRKAEQNAGSLTLSQRLVQYRADLANTMSQARSLEKLAGGRGVDLHASFDQIPANDAEGQEVYRLYQQKMQEADNIRRHTETLLGGSTTQPLSQAGGRQYQQGQVIQTPRGSVKVVGFDSDGHPLVEPAN